MYNSKLLLLSQSRQKDLEAKYYRVICINYIPRFFLLLNAISNTV